jgi:hypothetical protein
MGAPAGGQGLAALIGPDVPLDASDRVVLSGGDTFWLVNEGAGGLSAAPWAGTGASAPHPFPPALRAR